MQMQIHVILDNIRSAYNVGSAFRTCDGAGVEKIHICGISPKPPHPRLSKTALGATMFVDWDYHKTTVKAIDQLKKEGFTIYAIENGVPNTKNYKDIKYAEKSAFVFGHETKGVNEQILEKCDKIVEIPMHGKKNSLNVATTIGVILFNIAE